MKEQITSQVPVYSSTIKNLSIQDFTEAFGETLTPYVQRKIEDANFQYQNLTAAETEENYKKIVEILLHANLEKAGEHRLSIWEKGWGENLDCISKEEIMEALVPKYFNKFSIVRWRQQFIRPISKQFEYKMLAVLQDWLFDKYLRDKSAVYEFGCGTGHNLFRARNVNPKAELWGLDWATSSQEILNQLRKSGVDKNIFGHRFNYFEPDTNFHIKSNSAVVTVASLEQIGEKTDAFIQYLLDEKPELCIHIEPIHELLDKNNFMDFLSVEYFKKRNYLWNFLTRLQNFENAGKLDILKTQRSYIGSFFIEGYSVIVWKPKA
ncbi:MAG: hypothetical protein J0L93_07050 [Deltaproteobacteria bacterium]|nr:hypothetical protein [Deltaproteobacteria bacterium]